jgi:epoxyqueuosine reductase
MLRLMTTVATSSQPANSTDKTRARELSGLIKQRALAEGFEKVGIVAAAALDRELDQLLAWLGRGYHADMAWMARDSELRTVPRKLFPDARSIIVVAKNYYTPSKHSDDPSTGKVSRYAWGDDYHDVVGSRLRSMLSWIKAEVPEAEGKI